MAKVTQENPSVQFDCRAVCLNCSDTVALRLPGPVAWEWGRITGVGCHCGKPDSLVVQAEPIIPSKMPRIQPTMIPGHGFDRRTQGILFFSFVAFMAIALAIGLTVELMLNNSP